MMQVAFPEEASAPAFSLLFMFRCEDQLREGLAPKEGADELFMFRCEGQVREGLAPKEGADEERV
ncbi:hypothetical protein ACP70R_003987 [Stipagrostis hirtigluma subsp. patula]